MNDSLSQQHLSRIIQLELPICLVCNRIQNRAVLRLFSTVSWLGNGSFWAAAVVLLLALEGAGALPAIRHLLLAGAISISGGGGGLGGFLILDDDDGNGGGPPPVLVECDPETDPDGCDDGESDPPEKAIPEPTAALLFGLGFVAVLRRQSALR